MIFNHIKQLRVEGKTIGITFSTFDMLHAGHIAMLSEAKNHCDYLIAALQTDPTIDRQILKTNLFKVLWNVRYNCPHAVMWTKW